MAGKPKISPLIQKAAELQVRMAAIEPILTRANYYNHIYFNKTLLSIASLKNRNSSLSGLFNTQDKLSKYYYGNAYWRILLEKFPNLLEEQEIEINTFDLVEDAQQETKKRIILLDEVPKAQQLIKSVYNDHQHLYRLHPREFEEMIAEMLRKQDWEVKLTKQTRDQGVDIIAIQHIGGSPFKAVIECKRYAPNRKIGVEILRGFQSVILTQQANKGIIFTSSYFSPDAKHYQKQQLPYMLDLKDYDDIIDWIESDGIP